MYDSAFVLRRAIRGHRVPKAARLCDTRTRVGKVTVRCPTSKRGDLLMMAH